LRSGMRQKKELLARNSGSLARKSFFPLVCLQTTWFVYKPL